MGQCGDKVLCESSYECGLISFPRSEAGVVAVAWSAGCGRPAGMRIKSSRISAAAAAAPSGPR